MIIGIDVSRWQSTIDWPLLKAKGVEFAVIKCTQGDYMRDPKYVEHFKGAKAAGMLVGAYHWHDPERTAERQTAYLFSILGNTPDYDFISVDIEQYWKSWLEWQENRITQVYTHQQISVSSWNLCTQIRAISKKPLLIYSRASFIQSYAQPMLNWIAQFPTWWAYYPYGSGMIATTWEELQRMYLPTATGPYFPAGWPQATKIWKMWQFSGDKFTLPGVLGGNNKPSAVDLNFFNGTLDDMKQWTGWKDTEHPAFEKTAA